MRKRIYWRLLLAIMLIVGGHVCIWAVEQANYLEKFNGISTSKPDFAPTGWGHIVDYLDQGYSSVYVSYKPETNAGKDGAYIKAGSQMLADDEYNTKDAYDLLVTPLVKGRISFWIKNSSYSNGKLKLFTCTKNGKNYSKNEEIVLEPAISSTSSWQEVTLTLNEYTYIGFHLNNISLDEFAAEFADVPEIRAMEVTSISITSPTTVNADASGKFSISAKIKVKNVGNVDLKPGDEGFSFGLVNYSNSNEAIGQAKSGDFTLAVGATSGDIIISTDYIIPDLTKDYYFRVDGKEYASNTTKFGVWINVKAYVAKLETSVASLDYETFKGERSISVSLKNSGGAPLNMTDIILPSCYSIDGTKNFIMQSGESITKIITLGGEAGVRAGNVEFVFEGSGSKTIAVKGNVVGKDNWFEDFENGLPASWIIPVGANWKQNTTKTTTYSKKCMENSNFELSKLISPKVTVKEGESLNFSLGRNPYGNVAFQIRYSSDRSNWSEPIDVDLSGLTTSVTGFKAYSTNAIPAGDYYLAFEAGYLFLDNVYGYKLKELEHDFFINSVKVPGKGMVNNPVMIVADVTNMLNKVEAADSYSVKLLENDKVVANATTPEFTANGKQSFTLNYTPHVSGSQTLEVVVSFKGSDYVLKSMLYNINIEPEIAADENVVGNGKATDSNIPLRLNYKNSLSETIYKQDVLGLASGSKIVKIAYPYYTSSSNAIDISALVSIWIENTVDESPSTVLADTTRATMAKVYDAAYTFVKGGTQTDMLSAEFVLPEEFVYTGNNLRVIIKSNSESYNSSFNFSKDATLTNQTSNKSHDTYSTFVNNSVAIYSSGTPVVHLYTSKNVPVVSGKVTDGTNPLEKVEVSLTSGDILYKGLTDANGEYRIPVFQGNKEYTLVTDKIGYVVAASKQTVAESDILNPEIKLLPTNANIVDAQNINVSETDNSVALEGEGWTAENISTLASSLGLNSNITGIDMSHIDLPENVTTVFDNINPNCLIYVKEDAKVPVGWRNVVRGNKAEIIMLVNKGPFSSIKPFIARNISYSRTAHAVSKASLCTVDNVFETLCLPFDVTNLPVGCIVQEFTGGANAKVTFTPMEAPVIKANIPYLLQVAGGNEVLFEATDAEVNPEQPALVQQGNYIYCGTFIPILDGSANQYYVFDGEKFLKAADNTRIPPFRGYFKTNIPNGAPALSIDIDGGGSLIEDVNSIQGMKIVSTANGICISTENIGRLKIFSVEGCLVRSVTLDKGENHITGLPKGMYIINNQKVIIK